MIPSDSELVRVPMSDRVSEREKQKYLLEIGMIRDRNVTIYDPPFHHLQTPFITLSHQHHHHLSTLPFDWPRRGHGIERAVVRVTATTQRIGSIARATRDVERRRARGGRRGRRRGWRRVWCEWPLTTTLFSTCTHVSTILCFPLLCT